MNIHRLIATAMVFVNCALNGQAGAVLRTITWVPESEGGLPQSGEVVLIPNDRLKACLKVVGTPGEARTIKIAVFEKPGITAPAYTLKGQIRYEGVAGKGYLELWNHFPNGNAYFTKSLAESGPMQILKGSSPWRQFALPFYVRDEKGWLPDRPERLEFNLYLPGAGTVFLGPLELIEDAQQSGGTASAWSGGRTFAWVGTVVGGTLGVLGALVGVLVTKGRARRFVLTVQYVAIVAGVACCVAGVIALTLRQPYAVYFPLLLLGVVIAFVPACNLRSIRRRYEMLELQKMQGMDA